MNFKTIFLLLSVFFFTQSCEVKQGCDEDTIMYNLQHAYNYIHSKDKHISEKAIKQIESCDNYEEKMDDIDKVLYYYCKHRLAHKQHKWKEKKEYGIALNDAIILIESTISICDYLANIEDIDIKNEREKLNLNKTKDIIKQEIEVTKKDIRFFLKKKLKSFYRNNSNLSIDITNEKLVINNIAVDIYEENSKEGKIKISTDYSKKQVESLYQVLSNFIEETNNSEDQSIFIQPDSLKITIKGTADKTEVLKKHKLSINVKKEYTKKFSFIKIEGENKKSYFVEKVPFIMGNNQILTNKELALARAIKHVELFKSSFFKEKTFEAIHYTIDKGKEYRQVIFDIEINGIINIERKIFIENITLEK